MGVCGCDVDREEAAAVVVVFVVSLQISCCRC